MKPLPAALSLLSVLAVCTAAGERHSATAHRVLERIHSPIDLAAPLLPPRYVVPVTLSGAVADEIVEALGGMGLEAPRYEEHMNRRGAFSLVLSNHSYSLDTREMLSGILNPLELIHVAVNAIVRYRNPETFARLAGETRATVQKAEPHDNSRCRIELWPLGERFAYEYRDRGTAVNETWLIGLTALVDTVENLIYELLQRKCSREFDIQQASPPPVDSITSRYVFSYVDVDGHRLPSQLQLFVDGRPALELSVTYRRVEKYTLFETRTICRHSDDTGDTCLVMHYGTYRFSRTGKATPRPTRPSRHTRDIARAADLAHRAAEALRKGDIAASFRLTRRLVDLYPDTPQAIEAKRILRGIPRGF